MGHLFYDSQGAGIDVDDRLLAHLQVVIIAKLRRHEGFTFSWQSSPAGSSGRSTIWLHPGASLRFCYAGSHPPKINTAWIAALTTLAEQPGGLRVAPEPPAQDALAAPAVSTTRQSTRRG